MITQRSKETVEACRFCWMCRHICPIGNATGQERNTSRARALSLSMVARGAEGLENVIDNVYECALCGACTADCATGWDPTAFTKEYRLEAAMEGVTPAYIEKLIENFENCGNIYGMKEVNVTSTEKTDTLLFLGADARCKGSAANAILLLEKIGVSFTVLADEPDSGYSLDFLVGGAEETRRTMKKAAAVLNNFKTIIAYDPNDAKAFLREYREWDIGLSAEVKTFTSFLAGLDLKLKKGGGSYTLQDPAALARELEETEPARTLLSACGELSEMLLSGKDTVLAGNLIMNEYIPDIMKLVSQNRWANAVNAGSKTVVTASVADYEMLKETQPAGLELLRMEEVLLKCL